MPIKDILSLLAIALTIIGFAPYILAIYRGHTRPHMFSWLIWGITTSVVFFAQLSANGGRGVIAIGISAAITFYIALLAYRHKADINITNSDWLFLLFALSSIPAWYLASDPTIAVIILTSVDLLGFGPTLRKAYQHPLDENLTFFGIFALRNALVIAALSHYSIATVLFPFAVGICCIILIVLVLARRRSARRQ
ncbi:hypothetical protein [Zhongshania sp. BJYM1]|uniref:hypothetical protein n=1 Tax=Zhongshania aquatica TaxID=2965069 RepID=UPI0022B3A983|nr:hypothetical protein [Marortus sp. BJYM1]